MNRNKHADAVKLYFAGTLAPKVPIRDLAEALYAFGELGLFPDHDVDRVSVSQALLCWRIVEHLRTNSFPDELRM